MPPLDWGGIFYVPVLPSPSLNFLNLNNTSSQVITWMDLILVIVSG